MLTVSQHFQLLAAQYLASAMRPDHPAHLVVTSPAGPRDMKQTLQSAFNDDVQPYLVDDVLPPPNYNDVKNRLHASYVQDAIRNQQNPNLLRNQTPPVHISDNDLPRAHCLALAQLCSGHCSALNSYLVRVGRSDTSTCPECGVDDHSAAHLFSRPTYPTNLRPIDLWLRLK